MSVFIRRPLDETTAYEPSRTASWKGLNGPMPLTFHRTFDAIEGGTRVTTAYEATLRGPLKLLQPLLMHVGRRAFEGDIPKLKLELEGPL